MRSTTSQRYRSLGLCVHCGAARCPGSTVFCERHLLENRAKSRLRNRRLRGYQPWRPGGRGRPPLGREGEVVATARERYRAAGLCVHCGAARCPGSTVFCERHLLENRAKSRLRNRRLQGCQPWRPGGRGRPPLDRPRGDEREVA